MRTKYNPCEYEEQIYELWQENNVYSSVVDNNKKPFTIVMPPPNITGQLHMGHALNNSIQDAIIRYKRMKGYNVLYLPGTDHASIATELKIVEQLKQEDKSKSDIGREEFLQRAYSWKELYGGKIVEQLKKLGISCDWTKEAFTMDDRCSYSVKQAFVKMYNDGLIYQGDRIINWCIDCKTALSDAEVEYSEHSGNLWYIKYWLSDNSVSITVATTRPETILGDVAVAVNPKDKRYSALIGKTLKLPLTLREIPIIADEYVDMKFGTGVVKITPAHDPNDFLIGEKHKLGMIKIMDNDGIIVCDPAKGMDRYKAREYVVSELDKLGLLVKVEKHNNNIGHCYRCNTVVEPMVSKQWFVKMESLAKDAIKVVKDNKISFLPKQYAKIYLHWMNNIKDWCISRQLWWGHRIPVYYCDSCNSVFVSDKELDNCGNCGSILRQDEDVLDTWFSSALWPFSTLGYPEMTSDLKYYYPTNVLVTAYDIIFFWVARMIFSGIYHTKQVPFEKVLIHGIVRDENGRKMSKSLGNGIDPLTIIKEYGADSLRYSLLSGISEGSDIKYSSAKLEGSQNFLNKVFNAAKFVIMNVGESSILPIGNCKLNIADKWILTKLSSTISKVNVLFDKYKIGQVISVIYSFVWDDFCDWYIEFCKTRIYSDDVNKRQNTVSVLIYVLDNILKLLHPITPYITEELYCYMPNKVGLITVANYPTKQKPYVKDFNNFEKIIALIKNIRSIKKDLNIAPSKKIDIFVNPNEKCEVLIKNNSDVIEKLAGVAIIIGTTNDKCAKILSALGMVQIPYLDLIDIKAEFDRIKKDIAVSEAELLRATSKLANVGFLSKAPKELIDNENKKVLEYRYKIDKLKIELEKLNV